MWLGISDEVSIDNWQVGKMYLEDLVKGLKQLWNNHWMDAVCPGLFWQLLFSEVQELFVYWRNGVIQWCHLTTEEPTYKRSLRPNNVQVKESVSRWTEAAEHKMSSFFISSGKEDLYGIWTIF